MLRKPGLLIGALAALFLAWSPATASADSSRHGDKRDHRERHYRDNDRHGGGYEHRDRERHADRRYPPKFRQKSVYDDGRCRYTYKSGPRGTKEVVQCRGGHGRGHGYERGYYPSHARGDDLTVVLTQTVVALLTNTGYTGASRSIEHRGVVDVLERAPDGQGIMWDEPADGTRYQVVPTETYRQADGRYCREYLTTATVGGQTREVYGRACRQPDGAWEIVR